MLSNFLLAVIAILLFLVTCIIVYLFVDATNLEIFKRKKVEVTAQFSTVSLYDILHLCPYTTLYLQDSHGIAKKIDTGTLVEKDFERAKTMCVTKISGHTLSVSGLDFSSK